METKKALWLLFFGRLDDEKWFWMILNVLDLFINKYWTIPFSFYVFWKWKYVKKLIDLWQRHPSIHFFGRQSLETIKRYQENFDFCLMPSTFLETFGLTALNAMSMGIPVIWFSKWWLTQFIDKKYDISQTDWIDDEHKLFNLIEWLIRDFNWNEIDFEREKKNALKIAKNYTIENRFKNIEPIIWKQKRILIVSDFKSKLWWIETYIHDVANILNEKWYEVKIFGSEIPNGIYWKLLRYIKLPCVMWNFISWLKLKKVVREFMPKVIWYNSLLRNIWRYPVKKLSEHKSKKIIMYHDLWYFHPYPSKVTQENMVKIPLSFKNFIKSGNTKNPIKLLAMCFKFWSLKLLVKQLKKSVDIHLIPSDFMVNFVSDSFWISKKNIVTLPHFVQS